MPPEKSFELMKNRENKFTHESKKDIHERDKKHIIDSYNAACSLVDKYGWNEIKCVKNGNIRTVEEISKEILEKVLENIEG